MLKNFFSMIARYHGRFADAKFTAGIRGLDLIQHRCSAETAPPRLRYQSSV
jgi:hypothetical protein